MKQQESNLFDKGMSLDTNPIAMDNHTLSGALNATMITMNGNELVLQNDMGNARVETAYLPDGFVPVGMKEHGGIVYVASYNPISGQSLIGSFPSPQRNMSNDDSSKQDISFSTLSKIVDRKNSTTLVNITYAKEAVIIPSKYDEGSDEYKKDKDIIRPGDLLAFYGSLSENLKAYAKLSAIIVDSDNNSVDISDNFLKLVNGEYELMYSDKPTNIPYYKGKISGRVYLVETLKLPNYMSIAVGGDKLKSGLKLTITPTVDEPDFLGSYNYYIEYTSPNSSETESDSIAKGESYSIEGLPTSGIVYYKIWLNPTYGRIASISKSGSIDLSKVGTGEVEFKYFFYYNDTKREQIQFDYDIMAYLKDDQEITSCYLGLKKLLPEPEKPLDSQPQESLDSQSETLTNTFANDEFTHKIELPMDVMAGNFSSIIPYGSGEDGEGNVKASTLAMGKIYYGKLYVTTHIKGVNDEEVKSASSPVLIITSSVTNEYYMEHSTGDSAGEKGEKFMNLLVPWSNSGTEDSIREQILLYAETNWTDLVSDSISKEIDIPEFTNDAKILSENDSDYLTKSVLQYGKQLDTVMTVTATPHVKILYPDESFPWETEINVECSNDMSDVTYSTDLSWATSTNTIKGDLTTNNSIVFEEAVKDLSIATKNEESGVVTAITNCPVTQMSSVDLDNKIVMTFRNTLITKFYGKLGGVESYEDNNADALVPYITGTNEDYEISNILGCQVVHDKTGSRTSPRPLDWFAFETWKSSKNDRNRLVAIMTVGDDYDSPTEAGDTPGQGETSGTGSIGLFHTTSTNANWNFYSKVINDYYHNDLNRYPSILFLQGTNSGSSGVLIERGDGYTISTQDYAIPVMFSTDGSLYMLNEIGAVTKNTHPLSKIIDTLKDIYILQSGQVITLNYKKTGDYVYMLPYSITVNIPVKASVSLSLPNYPKKISIDNKQYVLPKFTLNPSDRTKGELEYEYETSYSILNPDIYSEIESYINVELQLSGCAIVPSGSGSKVITQSVHDVNGQDISENIDSSHPHYWNTKTNKLTDCYKYEIPELNNAIANALYKNNQFLMIRKDVNNDYNTIYINRSFIGRRVVDNCIRTIGVTEGKETQFKDIAPRHIVRGFFNLGHTLSEISRIN